MQSIYAVILKEIRRERKFNQRRLADAIQISPGTVAKFETGSLSLTLENLQKTACLFGFSVSDIDSVAEKYAMWLNHFFGYEIYLNKLENEEDDFMILANDFYKSEIFKLVSENTMGISGDFGGVMYFPRPISFYVVNKPSRDFINLKNVFRYITNESFRNGEIVEGYGRWSSRRVIFEECYNCNEVLDYFKFDPNIENTQEYNKQNFIVNKQNFMAKLANNSLNKSTFYTYLHSDNPEYHFNGV